MFCEQARVYIPKRTCPRKCCYMLVSSEQSTVHIESKCEICVNNSSVLLGPTQILSDIKWDPWNGHGKYNVSGYSFCHFSFGIHDALFFRLSHKLMVNSFVSYGYKIIFSIFLSEMEFDNSFRLHVLHGYCNLVAANEFVSLNDWECNVNVSIIATIGIITKLSLRCSNITSRTNWSANNSGK